VERGLARRRALGECHRLPQAIGLAATWDTGLVHRVADVISTEARAKYNDAIQHGNTGRYFGLTFWSPNINIFRDPRWGRGQETYGEDPYLTSRIAVAFVTGLQGDDPNYLKTVSTSKHFAVHSGRKFCGIASTCRCPPRSGGHLRSRVSCHHHGGQGRFGYVRVQLRARRTGVRESASL